LRGNSFFYTEVFIKKSHLIFDPIYGYIHLTPCEWEIIHTPFYQRLRWIKQLGFSCYLFPGAEHTRFGHSIGVMHNAHCILKSIGKAVDEDKLMDMSFSSKEATYHRTIRLAAMMHDLGTFPFSHTTEAAYIRFGETTNSKNGKGLLDDHENLGSYIIKNTDYEGGITHILKRYGIDPQSLSDLVKGVDPSILANQILHSEIDCDRMDYLLRDAHNSGMKYGTYDRDYLLHHFKVAQIGGHDVLVINHNALHCVEDFLQARFAWYSQVIRSPRGAMYDALAEELTFMLLEKGKILRYGQLLDLIANNPVEFYRFNDQYFMTTVHELYSRGELDKNVKMKELAHCILFEKKPKKIRCNEFDQRILSQDDEQGNEKITKRVNDKIEKIEDVLNKYGTSKDWIVKDIPKKNIIFVKSHRQLIKNKKTENLLLERDPVKILGWDGNVKLLAEVENSFISKLQNSYNYVPNVYASESAFKLLKEHGVLD
jgi:HD superfamily phosphohydrolase